MNGKSSVPLGYMHNVDGHIQFYRQSGHDFRPSLSVFAGERLEAAAA
jgi:hypothetical protein